MLGSWRASLAGPSSPLFCGSPLLRLSAIVLTCAILSLENCTAPGYVRLRSEYLKNLPPIVSKLWLSSSHATCRNARYHSVENQRGRAAVQKGRSARHWQLSSDLSAVCNLQAFHTSHPEKDWINARWRTNMRASRAKIRLRDMDFTKAEWTCGVHHSMHHRKSYARSIPLHAIDGGIRSSALRRCSKIRNATAFVKDSKIRGGTYYFPNLNRVAFFFL